MALRPQDTVNNDLPETGNAELDSLLNSMAEIGLAGMEAHNWKGYGSAPFLPQKGWQPFARKVMTVETAILVLHLAHLQTVHKTFVVSLLDQYRSAVEWAKSFAIQNTAMKIASRLAPNAAAAFSGILSAVLRVVGLSDDVALARRIQLRIRKHGLGARYDATEHILLFGKPQHPRRVHVVSTRNPNGKGIK